MSNEKVLTPLRVLCLDGGGMRGVYSAAYLSRLCDGFSKKHGLSAEFDLGSRFDLIVGTSTGAIVGCGLAKGVPLNKIVSLYQQNGKLIFNRPIPSSLMGVAFDLSKRSASLAKGEMALREALEGCLEDTTLGEIYAKRNIALAIPAVEMGRHRAWVFKTPHIPGTNHRDDDYSLVNVCLATSAAPIYRSLASLPVPNSQLSEASNVFADGGLWANNPVLVGLIDALEMVSPNQEILIYSLGTCVRPTGESIKPHEVYRGLPEWKFGADVAALSIDAQEMAYHYMASKLARHLRCKCRVIRFPFDDVPAHMMDLLSLDDTRESSIKELIRQAHADADFTNSKCMDPGNSEGQLITELFQSNSQDLGVSNV